MGFMVWRGLPCQARGRERALMTKRNKEKYLRMRSRISSRGFDRGRIKEGGCIVGWDEKGTDGRNAGSRWVVACLPPLGVVIPHFQPSIPGLIGTIQV